MMRNFLSVYDAHQWLSPGYLTAQMAAGPSRAAGFLLMLFAFIGLLLLIFWAWMLVAALRERFENKVIWIAILLIGGWLGAVVFYFGVYKGLKKADLPRATPPGAMLP